MHPERQLRSAPNVSEGSFWTSRLTWVYTWERITVMRCKLLLRYFHVVRHFDMKNHIGADINQHQLHRVGGNARCTATCGTSNSNREDSVRPRHRDNRRGYVELDWGIFRSSNLRFQFVGQLIGIADVLASSRPAAIRANVVARSRNSALFETHCPSSRD